MGITSCSDRSENGLEIIKSLDESLVNSNRILNASTQDILFSLKDKLYDAGTKERAQIWLGKAQLAASFSRDVFKYIDGIKSQISKFDNKRLKKFFNEERKQIYDSLKNYRLKILFIDPRIDQQFSRSLVVFSSSNDTSVKSANDLVTKFFDQDVDLSHASLTRLQNNIKIIENKVINFCHEQVGTTGGPCIVDWPFAGISSSVVEPGQRIEIIAGMSSFNQYTNTKVFIYGRPIQLKEDALAVCRFKAQTKPGKYYVPVKMNYKDQNGRQQTVQKEIEYIVADIQKQ